MLNTLEYFKLHIQHLSRLCRTSVCEIANFTQQHLTLLKDTLKFPKSLSSLIILNKHATPQWQQDSKQQSQDHQNHLMSLLHPPCFKEPVNSSNSEQGIYLLNKLIWILKGLGKSQKNQSVRTQLPSKLKDVLEQEPPVKNAAIQFDGS